MTVTRILEPTPTKGAAPSHSPPDVHYAPGISAARGLGWFSIGLGMTELLAPRAVSRVTKVRNLTLVQAYGLREVIAGIGILSSSRPTGWMWNRVAGDAMDLATLAKAGMRQHSAGNLASLIAVVGVTALDVLVATQLSTAEALEG